MPQQPNQIQNPKPAGTQQPKTQQLNDLDRLNDVLTMEKHLTTNFNIATYEASHQQLHQDMMQILMETHQAARQAYELMFRKGEYSLTAAQQQDLTQTAQQFGNYSSQLPYTQGLGGQGIQ